MLGNIGSDVKVVILDKDRDGVAQISAVLAEQENVSAVHIISHGGAGSLSLGATSLSATTLSDYAQDLQGWARALTPEADIVLYGCDVAAGAQGDAFIRLLSQLTGADVAASVDATGDEKQGGNWVLESLTGTIEAGEMLDPETKAEYQHLLAISKGTFQTPPQTYDVAGGGGQTGPVALGDINGDGKLDLAVHTTGNSWGVATLLGKGDGTFQNQQTNAITGYPSFVFTALSDMNGDGKTDIVAAGYYTVFVLPGNGDGTFQTPKTSVVGNTTDLLNSAVLGDINGDGRSDLVASSGYTVSALLGNGDGTFRAQKIYDGASSVALGDLNGDGQLDLAVANGASNTTSVLLGNGNGTFQAPNSYLTLGQSRSVTLGDVSGDGKLDLITAGYHNGTAVSVLLGNGNGTFQTQKTYPALSDAGVPAVVLADVNGDLQPDLVVSGYSALLGNGDGTFQASHYLYSGHESQQFVLGDMNGDGQLDLAQTASSGSSVFISLGDPTSADIAGSISTTSVLTVNGAAGWSAIDAPGDQDWWQVNLTAGNSYAFRVTANKSPLKEARSMRRSLFLPGRKASIKVRAPHPVLVL